MNRLVKCLIVLSFILLYNPVFAQTPDGETPAQEVVCAGEAGAAFGLCNAYCEAMDCDSAIPQATENACNRVGDKFINITGRDLPCEADVGCDAVRAGPLCFANCRVQGQAGICESNYNTGRCECKTLDFPF